MRADYSEFTRLFAELVERYTAKVVAKRIACSRPYIYQLRKGEYRPGRQFVEDLIGRFNLDRDEWLAAAGYSDEPEIPDTPAIGGALTASDTGAVSPTLLRRALGAIERSGAADYYTQGLRILQRQFDNSIVLKAGDIPARDATFEEIDELLGNIGRRMQEERDRKRGKGGQSAVAAAAPLLMQAAGAVLGAAGS